jgi:hypothetical protein
MGAEFSKRNEHIYFDEQFNEKIVFFVMKNFSDEGT